MENTKENAQKFVDQLVMKDAITEDDIADLLVRYADETFGFEFINLQHQYHVVNANLISAAKELDKAHIKCLHLKTAILRLEDISLFNRIFNFRKKIDAIKDESKNL